MEPGEAADIEKPSSENQGRNAATGDQALQSPLSPPVSYKSRQPTTSGPELVQSRIYIGLGTSESGPPTGHAELLRL